MEHLFIKSYLLTTAHGRTRACIKKITNSTYNKFLLPPNQPELNKVHRKSVPITCYKKTNKKIFIYFLHIFLSVCFYISFRLYAFGTYLSRETLVTRPLA